MGNGVFVANEIAEAINSHIEEIRSLQVRLKYCHGEHKKSILRSIESLEQEIIILKEQLKT